MLISCLKIGLTLKDTDDMSIGEMMDIVITFTNIFDYDAQAKNQTVRNATQEDFDRF